MSNWDDDNLDDDEWTDNWPDDDDETGTVTCTNCGEEIYEDVDQCPYCGEFQIAQSSSVWEGKPTWWILLGLLGIIAVVMTLSGLAF